MHHILPEAWLLAFSHCQQVFCFLILPLKCHPCCGSLHVRCASARMCVPVNFICMYSEYKYCTSPVLLGPDVDLHWSTALNVLSLFFFFVASWPLSLSCMCGCTIFCMCIYDHSVNHGKSTITLYSDSRKTNMVFVAQLNDNFSLVRTNELLK